jgi:hypothetical protein
MLCFVLSNSQNIMLIKNHFIGCSSRRKHYLLLLEITHELQCCAQWLKVTEFGLRETNEVGSGSTLRWLVNVAEMTWNPIQFQASMLAIQSDMWKEFLFRGSRYRRSYMWSEFLHRDWGQFLAKCFLKRSFCVVPCEVSSCTGTAGSSVRSTLLSGVLV